jgi:hypothetical protein
VPKTASHRRLKDDHHESGDGDVRPGEERDVRAGHLVDERADVKPLIDEE